VTAFFGIAPGETREAPGLRVFIRADGEAVWMHGKWLDLGRDHAVAFVDAPASFIRSDGKSLKMGQFPGWVVRGRGRGSPCAIMFNVGQFRGGCVRIGQRDYPVSA
jgi:hypothetical protein